MGLTVGQSTVGDGGFDISLSPVWSLVYLALLLLYFFTMETTIRRTVGKHLVGLRAPLSARGQPPLESAPPADVRPGQAGTLLDGMANPRDVTGTIVDLAVRGYLRIEEAEPHQMRRDWRLAGLNKTGGLLDYEQMLLDGLFQDRPSTRSTLLSDLGPAFTGSLNQAQDALYGDVAKRGWFTARPDQVRRLL
jgi:hypothetical protein